MFQWIIFSSCSYTTTLTFLPLFSSFKLILSGDFFFLASYISSFSQLWAFIADTDSEERKIIFSVTVNLYYRPWRSGIKGCYSSLQSSASRWYLNCQDQGVNNGITDKIDELTTTASSNLEDHTHKVTQGNFFKLKFFDSLSPKVVNN